MAEPTPKKAPPKPESGKEDVGSAVKPCDIATLEILVGGPYGDHAYGHVALRVKTCSSDTVYDYGRYGKVWGTGGSEGEGMLRIWSAFAPYLAGENATGRKTVGYQYKITAEQADAVNDHFAAKIKDKKANLDRGVMKQYRIEDYYALGPNCATLSVDGAKVAKPGLDAGSEKYNEGNGLSGTEKLAAKIAGWPSRIFMPRDLANFLDTKVPAGEPVRVNY